MSDLQDLRLQPLTDGEWPSAIKGMKDGFAGQLNVYRVMAHHPGLLAAWEALRNHVVRGNALTLPQLEIVILRAGHRWRSDYEWSHHVIRGLKAGLSEAQIERTRQNPAGWSRSGDDLLIQAVDALMDDGRLTPDLLASLQTEVGVAGVFDLMATLGMYTTLAFIVKTFETPVDDDIQAELDAVPHLRRTPD